MIALQSVSAARFHWGPVMKRAKQMAVRKRYSRNTTESRSRTGNASGLLQPLMGERPVKPVTNKTSNISALHADNDFLKKSGMMSDMQVKPGHSQSFTIVVVIASIFLFVTMAITMALVVFCRKRNTVFAFQKSEQEDYPDYEMDEMDEMETDVEYTETDSETETSSLRKQQRRKSKHRSSRCKCQQSPSTDRGDYQMVVSAHVDQGPQLEQAECSLLVHHTVHANQNRRFYGLTNMPPSVFQNQPQIQPKVNITYTEGATAAHNANNMYSVVVTMETPKRTLRNSCSDCNIQYHTASSSTGAKLADSQYPGASKGALFVSLPPVNCEHAEVEPSTISNSVESSCSEQLEQQPHDSMVTGLQPAPATHFMATGTERLGRIGSIRSMSREQCISLLSLRSNCPTQVSDQAVPSMEVDEQESLLEEYFLTNYAEDQMFSD